MSEGPDETVDINTQAVEPAEIETKTPATAEGDDGPPNDDPPKPAALKGDDEEPEEPEKPKRISGYDRMKRKNQYLQSEILRLQEQASKPAPTADKAPKEEDFGGDWGKYIAATAAHEAAKAVKGSLDADRKTANEARVAELRSEVLSEFEERTEAFKAKATDFDDVVSEYVNKGGKFSDVIRELVMESDLGPQLTYHLAKNPSVANKLNSLSPLQAAKEFARLEDTLSKPSKATQAKPPITSPKGGAGPSVDPNTGPDDMEAFATWLKKDQAQRRGRR